LKRANRVAGNSGDRADAVSIAVMLRGEDNEESGHDQAHRVLGQQMPYHAEQHGLIRDGLHRVTNGTGHRFAEARSLTPRHEGVSDDGRDRREL
jgi:hypothetical protein